MDWFSFEFQLLVYVQIYVCTFLCNGKKFYSESKTTFLCNSVYLSMYIVIYVLCMYESCTENSLIYFNMYTLLRQDIHFFSNFILPISPEENSHLTCWKSICRFLKVEFHAGHAQYVKSVYEYLPLIKKKEKQIYSSEEITKIPIR